MDDTNPSFKKKYDQLMMSRSGAERMEMAGDMYDSAKQMCLSGLKELYPTASPKEIRKHLFIRLYKNDVSPERLKKIQSWI